jgi:hypothetical protein
MFLTTSLSGLRLVRLVPARVLAAAGRGFGGGG